MCGIIFGANTGTKKELINEWIIEQYEDQYSRGHEGFGIVAIDDKLKYEVKRSTEGAKLMYDLHNTPARIMMFHHRMPTSTPNRCGQTHPMSVDDGSLKYKYLVIHNGVISNAEELKKTHENELGFVYQTKIKEYTKEKFNDSESFAIEIARYIEKQSKEIATFGSVAFTALQIDKKTNKVVQLFFGRNHNPLKMAKTRGVLRLSSEGMGNEIEAYKLFNCSLDEQMKLTKRDLKFATKPVTIYTPETKNTDYSDYSHYWDKKKKAEEKEIGFKADKGKTNLTLFGGKATTPKKADEYTKEEEMDDIIEPYIEELQQICDEFTQQIYDPINIMHIDIDTYMDNIKTILINMADLAMWKHTYDDTDIPVPEPSLPAKNYLDVPN